ncbi:TetR/AcrR family transcriptional regulator [Mycobacteroides salmoniphilum]|uniref:Putative HTH-type transcriptional regulator YxaF n=1 Tax=Mycobacteroides salmoniphilum TaxID=404941 RepID=A0A4R8SW72_9MYCO|nr:TetR/AcrR family transcriptional regulator [Mycobacteroides salmoniphilum]TDZ99194.1 putative HTH-type transcriptional regulator YxaF [Mycobacteroides salmoniphilum]TEA06550.1 putative HTH-type transcriptional regulator YxaF [Mycobacteroides salmoniphilum]
MSARDTLIASVTGLVRRRGVAGTGLNALLEDSGVSRRTIYLNFPGGKQELVAEATRLAGQELTDIIKAAGDGIDPARGIELFIELWKAQLGETEMQAGCPIVAAVLGRTEAPQAAAMAAEAFRDWHALLAGRLEKHGVDADTARSLARTMIAAIEGAVIMSIAEQSTETLDDVGQRLAELIRLYIPAESKA